MKVSYSWLKDLVEFEQTPSELGEALTLAGFEVDDIAEISLNIPGLLVGNVLTKEKHPDADKLSVCTVSVGEEEPLQIICGAPNVAAGQMVAVATIGSVLPNGLKIRKAKIRGVLSQGMICSEAELGLSEDADGIWVLPENLNPGSPVAEALGFDADYIFDIGITPNRPDALSHMGIAREISAMSGKALQTPPYSVHETGSEKAADLLDITIETQDGCPRYAARIIRGVRQGESPEWMAKRLRAVGMRPINLIVDITNYVLLELGHPLHAFDFNLVKDGKIIVRESVKGEKITTLDGKERPLSPGTVLICDAEKPVAIGGIMGGENSEINPDTVDIILESAYFSAAYIRRSLRHLGMSSEASQRFERGADPNNVLSGLNRATELLVELAGGSAVEGVVDNYPQDIKPVQIPLNPGYINKLLGTSLSKADMSNLLGRVNITLDGENVVIPTFRPDMTQPADVAEEVARMFGYDNIPMSTTALVPYENQFNPFDDFLELLRQWFSGIGLQEVVTNSMINCENWEKWTGKEVYPIMNPISADMNGMRNSLIPSLLTVLRWNVNRRLSDLKLFEIGRTFAHPGDLSQMPAESLLLTFALTGKRKAEAWHAHSEDVDFYDVKGVFEALFAKFSLDNIAFIPYDDFAVSGQSLAVKCDGIDLGYMGLVRGKLRAGFDLDAPVFVGVIDLKALFPLLKSESLYREIPKYPSVDRDLAILVDQNVAAEQVISLVWKKGGAYLTSVNIFDLYSGKQIDSAQKSIAFRMIFQSREKTLTEDEVNQATNRILTTLEKELGARLRS